MPMGGNSNEAQLIAAAKAGDHRAFDTLVAQHAPRLLALASRMLASHADAEDAVQNSMASAWLALHRFNQDKPVGPWLTTITINKCRDAMRGGVFRRVLWLNAGDQIDSFADPAPGHDDQIADRQLLTLVRREISRLPQRLKEPFVLVTFDGRSQAEAADILGITEKAVETRIYRARIRLREKFADL